MKKSNFVALVLGTIGMVFFALGMCMCLVEEWSHMFKTGLIIGSIGLVILLITVLVWRKMEHKAPIRLKGKTVATILVSLLGALLLGGGMALVMALDKMVLGIIIGLVGIVVLLMLIPLTRGLHD